MNKKTPVIPTPELLSEMESLQIFGGSQDDTMEFNFVCKTNCDQANCVANCETKCNATCDDMPPKPNTAGQCQ